ncbi:MAG: glycosyltransferase family 39 protein [Candidatus Woesearchaeota archaeon]
MSKPKSNLVTLILVTTLLLATIVRVCDIGKEPYWLDEAISIRQSQGSYSDAISLIKVDNHLPVYISILWGWVHLFGTSETSSRMLSAIFGIASVFMIFLVGRKMFNSKVGLIASIFLALSKIGVYYSQESRLYSLFLFLSLLSVYSYLLFSEKQSLKHGLLYFLSSLLMLYTHLFAVLIIAIQNLHYFANNYRKLRWMVMQALLALSFAPWLFVLIYQTRHMENLAWIITPSVVDIFNIFYDFAGNAFLLTLFVIVIVLGVLAAKPKYKSEQLLLILWLLFPIIGMFIASQIVIPLFHVRYFLFTLPALYLLVAWSIFRLKSTYIKIGCILAIIVASILLLVSQSASLDKADWRGLSQFMKANVGKEDIIAIDPFYQQDPFAFYYDNDCFKAGNEFDCLYEKDRVISFTEQCCDNTTSITAAQQKNLKDFLNYSLWLVSVKSELYDKTNSLFDYLNERKKLTSTYSFTGNILVYKFK